MTEKIWAIVACLVLFTTGCAKVNRQDSSAEKAKYVIHALPIFQEDIFYLSVASTFNPKSLEPSSPLLKEPDVSFVHAIVYRTGVPPKIVVSFLDDSRPPKIVFTKELYDPRACPKEKATEDSQAEKPSSSPIPSLP